MAGGSADAGRLGGRVAGVQLEVLAIAVLTGAAVVGFGIIPSPLLDLASDAARAVFG